MLTLQEIISAVEENYDNVFASEEQCPGVYYFACREDEYEPPKEIIVVDQGCPHISDAVKAYGKYLNDKLLIYDYNDSYGGKQLVKYEVLRYRALNDLPSPENDSILSVAACAADAYPDYFGLIPAPVVTPHGYLTRYMTLANGIYAIETDAGARLIAVAGIIWSLELQDNTIALGEKVGDLPEELTYLFFGEQNGCLALFELLHAHPALGWCQKLDWLALMNAIWSYHPDYALEHNLREQHGLNDLLGLALNDAEIGCGLSGSTKNMVALTVEAGVEYVRW